MNDAVKAALERERKEVRMQNHIIDKAADKKIYLLGSMTRLAVHAVPYRHRA